VTVVLDASALLALVQDEPGAERVEAVLDQAVLSSVNLTEVVTKLVAKGMHADETMAIADDLGWMVRSHDHGLAVDAGMLHGTTKSRGLSLGDRACLALGRRLGAPALTTDRAWAELEVGVVVQLIR
jgi:ribonuclease VapC